MIRGSAVVDGDGKIIFGDMSGVVHCLDSGGNMVWQYTGDDSTIASSPAIMDNGDVVYATTNGRLKRLTRQTLVFPRVGVGATVDGMMSPGEWDGALVISSIDGVTPLTNIGWNPLDGDVVAPSDCSFDLYLMRDGSYN